MKIGVQLNPQVAIDKPAASLMPTLIEQVRIADQSGFHAFSMGEHYNIPGLQRLHQIPALARLCSEVIRSMMRRLPVARCETSKLVHHHFDNGRIRPELK